MCRELNGRGNQLISQFARNGGRYIGFCAGGYYGSSSIEFEVGNNKMEVNGARELKFFPGIARGCVFKGFEYGSILSGHAASILVERQNLGLDRDACPESFKAYVNGGCLFVDADDYTDEGVEVLARYTDTLDVSGTDKPIDDGSFPAAAVYCKVGQGSVVVTGIHPEFSPDLLARLPSNAKYTSMLNSLVENNKHRFTFLRGVLRKMGMKVNTDPVPIPGLSRLSLTSSYPPRLIYLIENLQRDLAGEDKQLLKGNTDTFRLWDSRKNVFRETTATAGTFANIISSSDSGVDLDSIIKEVDVFYTGLPEGRMTSGFNHELYYNNLRQFQKLLKGSTEELGTILLYGEVVTSTSTMLYKNYNLLKLLPNGFSIVGSVQIAGRGRGNNVWVNPQGVLAVSTVLRMPLHSEYGHPSQALFTPYVVALAMVEAIKSYAHGYDCMPIRLKWPNDIYCQNPDHNPADPDSSPEFLKIGGLLVNNCVLEDEYAMVFGLGVDVNNNAPSTSLNAILAKLNASTRRTRGLARLEPYRIETLLAKFFVTLETMLLELRYQGFQAFEQLYYKRWLHTDKIVTLEQHGGLRSKIRGISMTTGMLLVQEIDGEGNLLDKVYQLRPDGNSFDMMRGLLKKKV